MGKNDKRKKALRRKAEKISIEISPPVEHGINVGRNLFEEPDDEVSITRLQ